MIKYYKINNNSSIPYVFMTNSKYYRCVINWFGQIGDINIRFSFSGDYRPGKWEHLISKADVKKMLKTIKLESL